MFPKEFIVSGKDIKQLPIRVACFSEDTDLVKKYLSTETSWKLTKTFEDNVLSTNEQYKFIEFLIGSEYNYAFDMFVIKNLSQIRENKVLIKFLVDNDLLLVPVFCIDSEQIVSNLSSDVVVVLDEISAMREDGLL